MTAHKYYSNGKLLISAEYAILDGAMGLALPTTFGQSLTVSPNDTQQLQWLSKDHLQNTWFQAVYQLEEFDILQGASETANKLREILTMAREMNPHFMAGDQGFKVVTEMDFDRNWGLGSSSTLINNIANWARIDAFELLKKTFGGSGYDIACAERDSAICYRLNQGMPEITDIYFDPPFKKCLFFIYLNQKKNSREGISQYSNLKVDKRKIIGQLTEISKEMVSCQTLKRFEALMDDHEAKLSDLLTIPTVKKAFFSDYPFAIKSLGAWGGDFILAAGNEQTPAYFKSKGFETVIPYTEMILV